MSADRRCKPWLLALEDEVCGFDELSHDGDDGDLGRLSIGQEALCEGLQGGIGSFGGEGGQVEQAARAAPAAGDEAGAAMLAAVAVEGGDPDQGGGLSAFHGAELGHSHDESGRDNGADAGQAEQQTIAGLQVLVGLDPRQDVGGEPP